MTFHWGERPASRSTTSQDPTFVGRYVAAGTKDSAFVKAYALTVTTPTVSTLEGVLYRNDIQVNPSAEGPTIWEVDVHYGRINRQVGSYSLRWEGSLGTERQFVSLATVARYPSSAPDYRGVMGVDDINVVGADVPKPSSLFTVEFRHPSGFFNPAQAAAVEAILGHVNSTLFFGYAPGEVLFWSLRGSEGTESEAMVEYQFVRKPNVTNQTIGNIGGITKRGHDHLWFRYRDIVSGNRVVRRAEAAYVEQVLPYSDLATVLGFGS